MSRDYPELEKTLIEIEDSVNEEKEEDILPLIDFEIDVEKKENNINIKDIYIKVRKRLISVVRRKFHEN
mgnify:CR=1 FL=1|tara:strand:+ start:2282 stop:2488 length:207 start_codon:yes stop_codon:yes gene_type:complete